MSENRIKKIDYDILPPDQPNGKADAQLKINFAMDSGCVVLQFVPPVSMIRFTPAAARRMAMGLLDHAERCQEPPPQIQTPEP